MGPSFRQDPHKRAHLDVGMEKRASDGLSMPVLSETGSDAATFASTIACASSPSAQPPARTVSITSLVHVFPPSAAAVPVSTANPANSNSITPSSSSGASVFSARFSGQRKLVQTAVNTEITSEYSTDRRYSSFAADSSPATNPIWSTTDGVYTPDSESQADGASSAPDLSAIDPATITVNSAVSYLLPGSATTGLLATISTAAANTYSSLPPAPSSSAASSPLRTLTATLDAPSTTSFVSSISDSASPSTLVSTDSPSTLVSTASPPPSSLESSAPPTPTQTSSAIPSSSQSSLASSTPVPTSASSSSTASSAIGTASPVSFFQTLGSSPANIAITILVCVGILAVAIGVLAFFVRRCHRRRKRRMLGDILGSDAGTPGSEWATPGPGWTEKYYEDPLERHMAESELDPEAIWQRRQSGMHGGDGMGAGAGWSAYDHDGRHVSNDWTTFGNEQGWTDMGDEAMRRGSEHPLDYDHGHEMYQQHPPLPHMPTMAPRPYDSVNGHLAVPAPAVRPHPFRTNAYPSYSSESQYPVDEVDDQQQPVSPRTHALHDPETGNLPAVTTTSPQQTTWKDSLDWVMGSAAELIGSTLLARGGSSGSSNEEKETKTTEQDRYTAYRKPSPITVPPVADPRTISTAFTPLSADYGSRFLDLPSSAGMPAVPPPVVARKPLSRQPSVASLSSSAAYVPVAQQGQMARGLRSRLADAAGEPASSAMDKRASTSSTFSWGEASSAARSIRHFSPVPFSARRHAAPALEIAPSTSSSSSSATYRPSRTGPARKPSIYLQPPGMRRSASSATTSSFASSIGRASLDAFGARAGTPTPREYHRRLSASRRKAMSKRQRAPAKRESSGSGSSEEGGSSAEEFSDSSRAARERIRNARKSVQEERARVLLTERRRRSEGDDEMRRALV
ncbi:hypothetical protein JCM21900_003473 [Sporobolomyces salmonicolor]